MSLNPADSEQHRERILHQFLTREVPLQRVQAASGGLSGDPVFQIDTPLGVFALRGCKAPDWPISRIRERHRWLSHLQREQLPVAVPLSVIGGTDSLLIDGDCIWQLEPWLAGAAATPPALTAGQRRDCLQKLARLHQASSNFQSSAAGREWFQVARGPAPGIRERRLMIASWSPDRLLQARRWLVRSQVRVQFELASAAESILSLFDQILDHFTRYAGVIDQELLRVENLTVPLFPCFRDLWSAHVLYRGDVVSGFIDPTAARTEHVAADLSRLLGSYFGDDRDSWQVALHDYADVRPLTLNDLALIRAFDRSAVLLSGMTWIDRLQQTQFPSALLDQIQARLQFLAGRSLESSPG